MHTKFFVRPGEWTRDIERRGAETHGYRLPGKWISADGKTMHLVFSGRAPNDAFCVRQFRVEFFR